jgi:beta-1,2-mannobiose phosphorylase / 1,2-beta-oligomannan phosphorylase
VTVISVEATEQLTLDRAPPLSAMYVLSPCVWQEDDGYHVLLRAVNHADDPADKVARIYHGQGHDGLRFRMDAQPAIAPSIDSSADDAGGCEDPSMIWHGGRYHVFYSGWNQGLRQGHLLRAVGADMRALRKRGRFLPDGDHRHNPKEAEIAACPTGGWRLFFEYVEDGRSKIGLAKADGLDGPWRLEPDPFAARKGRFDSWHLNPGPVIQDRSGQPLMLYNGATRDGRWRIGWITFDDAFPRVLDRCEEQVITPPPPQGDARDVAFAASAVQDGRLICLYYTFSDDQPTRAVLRVS